MLDFVPLTAVIAANSGYVVPEEPWNASGERYAVTMEQSDKIVAKLKKAGIEVLRPGGMPIVLVGLISGQFKVIIPYRNINIIPAVQSANHRDLLKTLSYYCEDHPYIRFFTFTTGARCPISEIRQRHVTLARRISKWAASPLCKDNKVEVIFARHEITFDKKHRAHFHAHVLVDCHKKLNTKLDNTKWDRFLSATADFFKAKIDDDGKLENPKEAVKYCLKPAEITKLPIRDVAELYEQLKKQKLVRCMGGLAAFRKQLITEKLKIGSIRRKRSRNSTWRRCLIPKEGNGGAQYGLVPSTDPTDIVLAVTPPAPIFTRVMEPCLVVAEYGGNLEALLAKRNLQGWRDAALKAQAESSDAASGGVLGAAKADPSTLDTSTITVQTASTPKSSHSKQVSPSESASKAKRKSSKAAPAPASEVASVPPPVPAKTGRVYKLKSKAQLANDFKERSEKKAKELAEKKPRNIQLPLRFHPRGDFKDSSQK